MQMQMYKLCIERKDGTFNCFLSGSVSVDSYLLTTKDVTRITITPSKGLGEVLPEQNYQKKTTNKWRVNFTDKDTLLVEADTVDLPRNSEGFYTFYNYDSDGKTWGETIASFPVSKVLSVIKLK
jgi:hypothetical protein